MLALLYRHWLSAYLGIPRTIWFLALINLLLIGFPLDGGRILQASLWPSLGYRQATLQAMLVAAIN